MEMSLGTESTFKRHEVTVQAAIWHFMHCMCSRIFHLEFSNLTVHKASDWVKHHLSMQGTANNMAKS